MRFPVLCIALRVPTPTTTAIINRICFMPATLRLTGSGVNVLGGLIETAVAKAYGGNDGRYFLGTGPYLAKKKFNTASIQSLLSELFLLPSTSTHSPVEQQPVPITPTNATAININRICFMPATLRFTGSGVNAVGGRRGGRG
jgi:hypothetical protein